MAYKHGLHQLSRRELYNFRLLIFCVFVVCACVLQLWFGFRSHSFLIARLSWEDVVATRTNSRMTTSRSGRDWVLNTAVKRNMVENVDSARMKKRWEKSDNKTTEVKEMSGFKVIYGKWENTRISLKKKRRWIKKQKKTPKSPQKIQTFSRITGEQSTGRLLCLGWDKLCCQSINCLRKYPLFPLLPSNTSFLRNLSVPSAGRLYGQRIAGRLWPPESGNYQFLVTCMASCEVWLGENEFPGSTTLFMKLVNNVTTNVSKTEIELSSNKQYFIDILLTVYRKVKEPLTVHWKLPNTEKFVVITQDYLVDYPRVSLLRNLLKVFAWSPAVRLTPFLESIEENGDDDDEFETIGQRDLGLDFDGRLKRTSWLDEYNLVSLPFESCGHKPSYLTNSSIPKFSAVWRTPFSSVFPRDNTGYMRCIGNRYPHDCQGNPEISNHTVRLLLRHYTTVLKDYNSRLSNRDAGLKIVNVKNIKEKSDAKQGSRFLLEVVLGGSNQTTFLHSSYVYMKKNSTVLCAPEGLTVDMTTTVNVVIVVKNQDRWLRHFLSNMEEIYVRTKESYLKIIIAYYGKEDAKLMRDFKSSHLPNISTIRQFGQFNKPTAIQSAVDSVQDPNSIIFLMDLHLSTPQSIISLVRKHTVQARIVFNPVVFRLAPCGSPASYTKAPTGFWETFGYGVLGIFKSDWDRMGGMMNIKRHGWGGEDWELLDRIMMSGLEVERLRIGNFYHFYHSKNNLWN